MQASNMAFSEPSSVFLLIVTAFPMSVDHGKRISAMSRFISRNLHLEFDGSYFSHILECICLRFISSTCAYHPAQAQNKSNKAVSRATQCCVLFSSKIDYFSHPLNSIVGHSFFLYILQYDHPKNTHSKGYKCEFVKTMFCIFSIFLARMKRHILDPIKLDVRYSCE